MANPATPWGFPSDPVEINTWAAQHAAWILIGGLLLLAFATRNQK